MKKLALTLMLVACLGMMTAPAYALPSCPHTNSAGVTSKNFGNCILNVTLKIITFGMAVRNYVCNAPPNVVSIATFILLLAGVPSQVINTCKSIIAIGCSDTKSLDAVIAFINQYNASHLQMKATSEVTFIDPTPIINWGGLH